jgi:pimeloyl-ACP methyl ester carboxylesterase
MVSKLRLKLPQLFAVLLFGVGAVFALLPAEQAGAVESGTCQTVSRAVRLAPLLPKNQTMVGDLCLPNEWAEGAHRVDVLVHGGSYNRTYWDYPVDYPNYSYVERTLQAGRATFAYDRLGAGDSSRPLSPLATVQAEAYILHQLVGWLESDYDDVNIVGHSFGSLTALESTALYKDVDTIVLTGLLHSTGPGATQLALTATPAEFDPQFAGQGYDLGYLTTGQGQRGPVFYGGITDQAVIDYDEANKDVIASGLLAALGTVTLPPPLNISSQVKADVLVISGEFDNMFCGINLDCTDQAAVTALETPFYPKAASVEVQTVADTGHNLALHPSAGASFNAINQWIETH